MFALAAVIGAISYLILFLGVVGVMGKAWLVGVCVVSAVSCAVLLWKKKPQILPRKWNRFRLIIGALLVLQMCIALLATLAPELGFDALWYHLTLPKLFLDQGKISFIPGSLFSYSVMPKLVEMFYVVALGVGNEIWAKLIHFGFGLLILSATYLLARRFLSRNYSLLTVLILSSNLVFAWQMTTAYVDLARTWFEVLALLAFLKFDTKGEMKWLAMCGVMIGLAVSTKIVAIVSLPIFIALLFFNKKFTVKNFLVLCCSLLIPLPWFLLALFSTGNPIYPLFSNSIHLVLPTITAILHDVFVLFFRSADPINPLYIIVLPLMYFQRKMVFRTQTHTTLAMYCLFALILWIFTPRDGGGRFILPYLPAFSVLAAVLMQQCADKKIQKLLLSSVVCIAILTIGSRAIASLKYIPYLLGRESKETFLMRHLNFSFGDFYDEGAAIKSIVQNNTVLIIGGHNLYYADFPFVDDTQYVQGQQFSYILTIDRELPHTFAHSFAMYSNQKTKATLFKTSNAVVPDLR